MFGSFLSCPKNGTTETACTQNHQKLPVWHTWHIVRFFWCLIPSGRNLGTLCSQVTISAVPKNVQSNPSIFRIYQKYVRWSILWLKAPSQTFDEIFVPQDFTINDAPGRMAPANTCGCDEFHQSVLIFLLFNRPGLAGAVLQTPLSFIHSFINQFSESSFSSRYSNHFPDHTVRANELKFWENIHHMSYVTCHMSHVTRHMSHVLCHVSLLLLFIFVGKSCGASWWRVCYQRGLPHLIFFYSLTPKK